MSDIGPPSGNAGPRRPLFRKYFAALFLAVVVPLAASGASDAWFGYQDQRATIARRLHAEAAAAEGKIQGFLDGIRGQLEWTVQLPWTAGSDERHRFDALRLLRQVPAVVEVILVDGEGKERLRVSRTQPDIVGAATDRSGEPAVAGARARRVWYGPMTLHEGSEPYMTIAVAGARANAGVTIAEINLKLIWDVISSIHVGATGAAFVLDPSGRLVAHPDISLVLRGGDAEAETFFRMIQAGTRAKPDDAVTAVDAEHRRVLVAMAPIAGPDWMALAAQPLAEAFTPIRAALWRTALLLLAGAAFAGMLAFVLARRMVRPIRVLEDGAARIGAGRFDHRIEVATGDELEGLAARFNAMASELALSQERSERIARLKRFLAPQVAELLDSAGQEGLLDSHRTEVAVIFCDLRGFTAFSGRAAPDEVMGLLGEYYEALGTIIMRYEATLTCFMGDGLMLLLNAPVACPDPALRAVRMALDMQKTVQALIAGWSQRGYTIGFGIGIAKGTATVGRIGYEGRLDYTAIGSVVNLASRICATARDGQILIDPAAAAEVSALVALQDLGTRPLKGFAEDMAVYSVKGEMPKEPILLAQR